MAGIQGLVGFSKSSGDKYLISAYGNDFVNVASGLGYGQAINPNFPVSFASYNDILFWQNFNNSPTTFNGTTWSKNHVSKLPLSKFIYNWLDRMYLGYVKIGSTTYPNRVWNSNLPKNDIFYWGYETSSTLRTWAGSKVVVDDNAYFKTYGLQEGNPFFITSGADAGEYLIETIESEHRLTLTEALTATTTTGSYWAGGNYVDYYTNDNDVIMQLHENYSRLLVFKRDSLFRYDQQVKVRIPGSPGTTSSLSVATCKNKEWTLYWYSSTKNETGFYLFNGSESKLIRSPIQKYIDGINSNMYGSIVGWTEGRLYRAYVGNITNSEYDISIPRAVITFDTEAETYSIDPIAHTVVAATQYRQASQRSAFLGTSGGRVVETPSGNSFDDSPISWIVETADRYPVGTGFTNTFTRAQVMSENAESVRVEYKLKLKPFDSDQNWRGLGQLTGAKTEMTFPTGAQKASGYQLRFDDNTTAESNALIKMHTMFYRNDSSTP